MKAKNYIKLSGTILVITLLACLYFLPETPAERNHNLLSDNNDSLELKAMLNPSSISPERQLNNKNSFKESLKRFKKGARALLKQSKINKIISEKIKLERVLKEEPRLARSVPDLLIKRSGKSRAKLAMVHSLAEAETRESKEALALIMQSGKFDESLRLQAIISSSELLNPGDRIINELWKISGYRPNDAGDSYVLDSSALLTLGTIASKMETQQSAAVVDKLVLDLKVAEQVDAEKAVQYLDALGNSGDKRVVEIAEKYILSPSPEERSLGAGLLRKSKEEKANQMLLSLIDLDESSQVRNEAVKVISMRKLGGDELKRLAGLMLEEPEEAIRYTMILNLSKHVESSPNIRLYFEKLLLLEDNQQNYTMLDKALNGKA